MVMLMNRKRIAPSRRWLLFLLASASGVLGQRAVVNLGVKMGGPKPSGARRRDRTAAASDAYILQDDIVIQDDTVMAMGGLEKVDLSFQGIALDLKTKGNGGTKEVLDGSIRGRAQPGRMLAIMGPSGAGKSTILHALAGRLKESKKLALFGERFVNGAPVAGDCLIPAAFVPQEMNFFPHMTVRETLNFRIELKLGHKISKSKRDQMAQELLEEVGLEKAADTIVGDTKVRGISGGERRRLSIACELISSPSLIFLDEPTSGLDSTAATTLVETLRSLADAGKTVVAVIHQPSQHVFAAFDDLLLVSEGKQMYFGDVKGVRRYFESNGHPAPSEMGTAEHIIDCISISELPRETETDALARLDHLAEVAAAATINLGVVESSEGKKLRFFAGGKSGHGPKANIFTQFKLLFRRSLRENFRGKAKLIIQTVQQVSLSLIYGGIYNLGTNQASIQDRFGILSLIAIGAANIAMASTIRSFPKEKAIVSGEIASKMYNTFPYFIGKAISEIPQVFFFNSLFGLLVSQFTGLNNTAQKLRRFLGLNSLHSLTAQSAGLLLGAISPNQDTALALFPAIMVLNIIFDGRNISEENTPRLLRWLPKVGLIRWGFEGLAVNEFEGLTFDAGTQIRGPVAKTGKDALSRFGLADKTIQDVVRAQLIITTSCWFMSFVGLTLTRDRFETMEAPTKRKKNGKSKHNKEKDNGET